MTSRVARVSSERMLLLSLIGPVLLIASAFGTVMPAGAAEPVYRFRLVEGRQSETCSHMRSVLNDRFARMWETPAFDAGSDNAYSVTGKYAFPAAPGAVLDSRTVYAQRYSKWPTSSEFEAIPWVGTFAVNGNPGVEQYREPILLTYFDIDNDGRVDTVMRNGFGGEYDLMANPRNPALYAEYLSIWTGRRLVINDTSSLWNLLNGDPPSARPAVVNATRIRAFQYKGRSYLLEYGMDVGADGELLLRPPHKPKETMRILEVQVSGRRDIPTNRPMAKLNIICRFTLQQR